MEEQKGDEHKFVFTLFNCRYKILVDSDEEKFGGHNRLDHSCIYFTQNYQHDGREHSFLVRHHLYTTFFS